MTKPLVIISAIAGILLLLISIIYFAKPANALPSFFPGFNPSLSNHHIKHGIGAFLLSLGAFSFAWFQSASKLQKEEK